jgi:hypothetical protein
MASTMTVIRSRLCFQAEFLMTDTELSVSLLTIESRTTAFEVSGRL